MKIRTGFVSNSSSSSFVLLGVPAKITDVTEEALKTKKFMIEPGFSYEGTVHIYSEDMDAPEFMKIIDKIKGSGELMDQLYGVYEYFARDYDSRGKEVIKADLPDKFNLYGGEEDQHSPRDFAGFEELTQYGEY